MAKTVRKTGGRSEINALWQLAAYTAVLSHFSTPLSGAIGNGTTAGNLRTTAITEPHVAGLRNADLASSDDFWDLSGETDTTATEFRAYWLYVDNANSASFVAGAASPNELQALGALPAHDETKSILGVFVAGVSTDFDDAGGLAAQGTIFDQPAPGANVGGVGGYTAPQIVSTVAA